MRTREVSYNNQGSLIVYVTGEENKDTAIRNKLNEYRNRYRNVIVFISGEKSIRSTLEEIIKSKVS